MKLLTCLAVVLALTFAVSGEQQRILRRVIKSTPTATNLGRIRAVTVRSAQPEAGAVTEISGKEAANFGQRGANATATAQAPASPATKTRASSSTTTTTTTTTSSTPTTSTTAASTTSAPAVTSTVGAPVEAAKRKASERQRTQPAGPEVELLSSAPSSWQTMTAVEAPAAMLIATGTRPAAAHTDLSASGSTLHSSDESAATGDFLRSSASKTSSSFSQSAGDTFSRVRQQSKQNQQQSFFYPQPAPQQPRPAGKTSNYKQATKTHWYQPSTTTARPAPIIQQEQQQYEQQSEQYVEQQQQQQVEYGAAPLGQAEPFAFDFKTEDNSGNGQYRKEESDKNGVVRGSYGYTDASGIYRHVDYVADQNGFRANIKSNEPGLIGETQPASIQLAGGPSAQPSSRLQAAPGDNGEWNGNLGDNQGPSNTESALAPPDFESSHKSDRLRVPRHYRN